MSENTPPQPDNGAENPQNDVFNSGIIRKTEYFDLFISYKRDNGGDHGQKLAEELYDKLTKDGYKVWLDNQEIGFSSNFEQRIEEAILHSKKVACILSPMWVESENCRYEIKKAIDFEKRIIPIHYKEFRTLLASKKDEGLLTVDEWNRIDKPQEVDFSSDSKKIKGYKDLKAVCDLKDDITQQHTRILCESYYWSKYKHPKSMLLRGTELSKIKLLKSKCDSDAELPTFSSIQNEFVSESQNFVSSEVSNKRKVFISYGDDEKEFAQELNMELKLNNVSTWFDEKLNDNKSENTFVESMINSESVIDIAGKEVSANDDVRMAFARSNNKRIIQVTGSRTVLARHKELGEKNIYYWNGHVRIDELITTINGDQVYNAAHAKLLSAAFEWERSEKSNSKLLGLKEAKVQQEWYQLAEKAGTEPQPNLSMINFVERSVTYADSLRKRRRMFLLFAVLGSVLLIGFVIASIILSQQKEDALIAEDKANIATKNAKVDKMKADKAAEESKIAAFDAEIAERNAKVAEIIAKIEAIDAESRKTQAEIKARSAEAKEKEALQGQFDAELAAKRADTALNLANAILAEVTLKSDSILAASDSIRHITEGTLLAQRSYDILLSRRSGKNRMALEMADSSITLLDSAQHSGQIQSLYSVYSQLLPKDSPYAYLNGGKETKDSLETEITSPEETMDLYPIAYNDILTREGDSIIIGSTNSDDLNRNIAAINALNLKEVSALCLNPGGNKLAVGYLSGSIEIWDLTNKSIIDSISKHRYRITSIAFGPKGQQIAASCIQNKISIAKLDESGKKLANSEVIVIREIDRVQNLFFWNQNILMTEDLLKHMRVWSTSVQKLKKL